VTTARPAYSLTSFDPALDTDAVARMLQIAFAGTVEGIRSWVEKAGADNFRVLRPAEAASNPQTSPPEACLLRVPMAHYFGGRPVPVVGIAGVAVPPEHRGGGRALALMRSGIQEIAAEGIALSSLYASTQALYRQVGYEQAGHACAVRLPVANIDVGDRARPGSSPETAPFVPLTDADAPAIEDCYRAFASSSCGALDRGSYIWNRIRANRDKTYMPFGLRNATGGLDAYVFLSQDRKPDTGRHDLTLSDLAFLTHASGRRLLGFLRDFASMADDVTFQAGPWHPLLALLSLQRFEIKRKEWWMLRITSVKAALEERGYSPALAGTVHLRIADDLVAANNGDFVLSVSTGRATLTRGGTGAVSLSIRALAAIYSGMWSARDAALLGQASGDSVQLDLLSALLATGTPWLADFF